MTRSGPQREDPFRIRIEQRADARKPLHLGRIRIEAADAGHPAAGADGKEDLGERRKTIGTMNGRLVPRRFSCR